jgi:hypothetical protein
MSLTENSHHDGFPTRSSILMTQSHFRTPSTARPNRKIDSTYFGPIHPEAPPFRNPEEDLRKIGVRRTAVIRKGIVNEQGIFEAEK